MNEKMMGTLAGMAAMSLVHLSTACMVMGAKKAHALAARLPAVDRMTVNKRGVIWKSRGFPAVACDALT